MQFSHFDYVCNGGLVKMDLDLEQVDTYLIRWRKTRIKIIRG